MTRLRVNLLLIGWLFALPASLWAQRESEWVIQPLSTNATVEYDFEKDLATGTNGIMVRYGGAVLTAESVAVNQSTGEVEADGTVRIQQGEQIWASEHMRYNFKTRRMQSEQFRTGKTPVFAGGENLHADVSNNVYYAEKAIVTADDIANPLLKVRASLIRIIPGDRIEAHNATLYIGKVPVFWFPFFSRPLKAKAPAFGGTPGYRTRYGAFLLGTYDWALGDELSGTLHADYRTRRGVGVGPDFNLRLGPWGEGTLRYYYAHDLAPNLDNDTGQPIPKDRQRVWFGYQANPATNLFLRSMVRYQTDFDFVREFFESEYRHNPQPSTFVEVNKVWPDFSLDTYVQPRVNDFLETVERLPDVRLTAFRQPIGSSPLYYESETSAGYYRRLFAETNGIPGAPQYEASRVDSYHQFTVPYTFFGWLNVAPRVGGRITWYSEASGPGADTAELTRGVFNTGVEASFKASRVWPGVRSAFWDADGVRHVFEPFVNYVYVPQPNYGSDSLPQFDYVLPNLRIMPIDFPAYNAIDQIDTANVLRMGMRHRLQTKRDGAVVNFVNWDLYTDWRIQQEQGQNTFDDVFSDITLRPRSWLTLENLARYDPGGNDLRLSLTTATLEPNNSWSFFVGHYYLRDNFQPAPLGWGEGNDSILIGGYHRVNENWGFRTSFLIDLRGGRLQEQSYTIYRDLRSWTAGLNFRLRNDEDDPHDFTVAFTFSLKSFPKYELGKDKLRPYWLLGG